MGFEVVTAVMVQMLILWDYTPCNTSTEGINQRFGGIYDLHLQVRIGDIR
jgi:hypothetical protein